MSSLVSNRVEMKIMDPTMKGISSLTFYNLDDGVEPGILISWY